MFILQLNTFYLQSTFCLIYDVHLMLMLKTQFLLLMFFFFFAYVMILFNGGYYIK